MATSDTKPHTTPEEPPKTQIPKIESSYSINVFYIIKYLIYAIILAITYIFRSRIMHFMTITMTVVFASLWFRYRKFTEKQREARKRAESAEFNKVDRKEEKQD